ncbi:MAG TPA: hypothetical protein VKB81_14215 [Nitrospira sp.]|nr:hypothetical protein [Nitrospira sp.]
MRLAFLLFELFAITGCMLFDMDESPQEPIPATSVAFTSSCADLWKHYTDELQLINDDEVSWRAHDDNAVQYLMQFSGSCNVADTGETAATELRCKALWSIYMKESGRMTKDDRTWREHDLQQVEAMNRIRSNCNSTACKFLPGIRCLVPNSPS